MFVYKRIMMPRIFIFSIVLFIFSCNNKDEGLDFNGQLDRDIATIDSYLDANAIQAYKDKSGIRFVIHQQGQPGVPPKFEHTVKVNLTGKFLINEETFYSATTTERPLAGYDSYGLKYAISLFTKGTKATVYVPSGLAYGNIDRPQIPANSNLIYEVELIDITKGPIETAQLASDINTIDAKLSQDGIVADEDPSGLRYTIEEAGTGAFPGLYDKVKFNYTLKKFETGETVATGTNEPSEIFDSRVVDYMPGLIIGLQKLSKGGKGTFYVPSSLGLGANGSGDGKVGPNTNLIYEIEFVTITL
jgi:FKBP-type peptidyl-prolyl cis-trans isomerase FkpA